MTINILYRYIMEIIEITTLIDITQTKVDRLTQGSQLEMDQNKNFNILRQCLEMRSVISYDNQPVAETLDIKNKGFGSLYKGKHRVWTFVFTPDRENVYLDESGNQVGYLIDDVHEVPVIQNLKESINITRSVFDCKDSIHKNTIIKAL